MVIRLDVYPLTCRFSIIVARAHEILVLNLEQDGSSVGWFSQLALDTRWLSSWVYIPTYLLCLKMSKNRLWYVTMVLKKYENVEELVVLYQFFHAYCKLFKVCEIARTDGSLILEL